MYKFQEDNNGLFTPAEINLIGGIFAHARSDYEFGWRKIQEQGGLDYLKNEYAKACKVLEKYEKHRSWVKNENVKIGNYNRGHIDKKKPLPLPQHGEKELHAKKVIEHYVKTTEMANSVEAFLRSKWFEDLSLMAGLSPEYLRTQFNKIRDEIISIC